MLLLTSENTLNVDTFIDPVANHSHTTNRFKLSSAVLLLSTVVLNDLIWADHCLSDASYLYLQQLIPCV